MKQGRLSNEQIVRILRETDQDSVAVVAKRHSVSDATIYIWRKKFGQLDTDEVKRLKVLEAENARLKKMLVDRDLEIEVMKEINAKKVVSAQAQLEQVHYAVERGLSQRRACALMRAARSELHYELRMPVKDAPVIEAMKDLSEQFPRFGARRIHIFLARQGIEISKDRCSRIWSAAGLQVPARKKRRRGVARNSPRPMSALGRNSVWCYDFVFDSCANGQQLKYLTVVD